MIVEKKIQSKNKEKQLNTIKQIYKKKHSHINDISQEISYDVFFRKQCTEVQTETLYDSINSVDIACLK